MTNKKIDLALLARKIQCMDTLSKEEKSELTALINRRHYGLVWKTKPEGIEERLKTQIPYLKEDISRRLLSSAECAPNHIIVESDNYPALIALSYAYAGKVDVIYIDPPYNTGKDNDFIYNDKIVDAEDSFRHSKWLSFMEKRLKIAKRLLSESGVIFISIDDHSAAPLKMMCDSIFEYSTNPQNWNHLATLIWNKQHSQQQGAFKRYHEYIFVYAKNKAKAKNLLASSGIIEAGAMKKISSRNPASTFTFPAGTKFEAPDGTVLSGTFGESEQVTVVDGVFEAKDGKTLYAVTLSAGWTQKNQMKSWFNHQDTYDSKGQKIIEFYFNSTGKLKCRKERKATTPSTLLPEYGMGSTQTSHLEDVMGRPNTFSNPKPVEMIQQFIEWYCPKDGIVLDFFAGSGTTFESCLLANEDGGCRRCILVQTNDSNICEDSTYPRCHNIIKGYNGVEGLSHNNLRYYRTDFIDRNSSYKNKRKLVSVATDLLCIKEDLYDEKETFGGITLDKRRARYFEHGSKRMLVICDETLLYDFIAEIREMQLDGKIKVYVFSDSAYAYEDDFAEVIDKVEPCALPAAILAAYKDVLPERAEQDADGNFIGVDLHPVADPVEAEDSAPIEEDSSDESEEPFKPTLF